MDQRFDAIDRRLTPWTSGSTLWKDVSLTQALSVSFGHGPAPGGRAGLSLRRPVEGRSVITHALGLSFMPTVHREAGFQVRIFFNDHPPPHVHAINVDGFAKIMIGRGMAPHLVEIRGLKARDIVRAVRIVAGVEESLLEEWIAIHGEADAYR